MRREILKIEALQSWHSAELRTLTEQILEKFKSLEELTNMDEKHRIMGSVCGSVPNLDGMHKYLSGEVLNDEVPGEIKGQFNVAKNMAIYSFFFYALAPEVNLKTYTVIEHALRIRVKSKKWMALNNLVEYAVAQGWITDSGFRHIENSNPNNEWCKHLAKTISSLRNSKAHGSSMLDGDCLHHITLCADFINQLFPAGRTHSN